MNALAPTVRRRDRDPRRTRLLLTPEGLALPLTLASRGARAGALLLDLLIIFGALLTFFLLLAAIGLGLFNLEDAERASPAFEFVAVLIVLLLFLSRFGYFLWFELGPRAATPGKRLMGIRVAARPVEGLAAPRLTAEAVIARNLLRDVEVFLPTFFLLGGGQEAGVAGLAAMAWLGTFIAIPFVNRDRLRAGDIVAGTWVVEAPKSRLPKALSLGPDRSSDYRFGPAELSVYGEHELQVLESVLRQNDAKSMREVAETICRRIGWENGAADEREFLEGFYAALRAHLERDLRFGRRKADKHS